MWFSSWLRRLTSHRVPRGRTPQRLAAARFWPRLEALEDRWVPSQIGLTVTSVADSGPGTLRAAITTADAGSPSDKFKIGFAVTGTIDLLSPLPDLNNSITIQGPGASSLTVEQATGASFTSAIVTVDGGQTASLAGLTIANGSAGGIVNNGTLTVSDCTVSGNSAFFGGGIANISNSPLTVSGCTLSGNSAFFGGGIFNESTLVVRDSVLTGNTAHLGGGIANENQDGSVATVTVSGSTLCGNSAIAIVLPGRVIGGFGGGIYSESSFGSATVTVSDSTLSGNFATVGGGAIFQDTFNGTGTITITGSTLCGNTASEGGAIGNDSGMTLVVRGSSFSRNTASDSGGAIYNLGTATLQDTTLSGNTAGSKGGGIFNGASGTLTIDDSVVLSDLAFLGADLYNLGSATLHDSTVGVIGP
jgi:predicted outer membrane repeat protein